jgi:hypothetical protein
LPIFGCVALIGFGLSCSAIDPKWRVFVNETNRPRGDPRVPAQHANLKIEKAVWVFTSEQYQQKANSSREEGQTPQQHQNEAMGNQEQ